MISTLDDLKVFVRNLAAGRLFRDPETVDRMLAVPEGIAGLYYASGMIVFPTADGPVWYMMGSNGTWVEYFPASDLVMIGTTDDLSNMPGQFMVHMQAFQILAANGLPTPMAAVASPATLVLAVCVLLLLVLPVIWLVRALWGRLRKRTTASAGWSVPILIGTVWFVNLLTLTAAGMAFGENIFQMLFGLAPDVRLVLSIAAVLMAILALGLGFSTILLWRHGKGSRGDRWLAAALSLVALMYVLSVSILLG